MGLFDETNETPSSHEARRMGNGNDTLFDWLIRKAEADVGLAQAFAAGETERADQIKRLEATLVGQIRELQYQILDSREAELKDLRSEIFAFSDRMERMEAAKVAAEATKEFVREELGALRAQLAGRHTELESRHAGFERLGESLGTQIRSLEEQIRSRLGELRAAQGEFRHFQSETQSLTERVGQVESTAWQTRTLAARNAKQLEQTGDVVKSEIAAIKAELAEQQRNIRLPESLLKDIEQGLGAKIEEIQAALAQEFAARFDRDTRLGQFDSGLAELAERVAKSESRSHEAHALAQSEANSALAHRELMARELGALQAAFSKARARESAIQELEAALGSKIEEWRHQAAQKFILLENRDAEREKSLTELAALVNAKMAEQDARTAEQLRGLESGHQELLRFKPEIQTLEQRVVQAESAAGKALTQFDAGAKQIGQLEGALRSDIAALQGGLADLSQQQRAQRVPEERINELERSLGARIEEIQRQSAAEREGQAHWEKGLRETFSSELSAMQARLSERQSQIEHRHARLEGLENTVAAGIRGFEAKLAEKNQVQDHHHEQWTALKSEIASLAAHTSEFEAQVRRALTDAATNGKMVEETAVHLSQEFNEVKAGIDARLVASVENIARGMEDKLTAKLSRLENQVTQNVALYDHRDSERARHSDQALINFKNELEAFKTALDQKPDGPVSTGVLTQSIEESFQAKIHDVEQKFVEKFDVLAGRDADRAGQAQKAVAALQADVAALRSSVTNGQPGAEAALRGLEISFAAKVHELQEQVAQKLTLVDQRDTERNRQAEQIIAGLRTDVAAVEASVNRRPADASSFAPALRGIEERVSAQIDELRRQVAEKFTVVEARDSELKELQERSQSVIQRVAQLAAAVQVAQNGRPNAVPPAAAQPAETAAPAPEANSPGGDALVKGQAFTEKERLTKLQERMSLEIERVRAELKERSGRWKVRKNAS